MYCDTSTMSRHFARCTLGQNFLWLRSTAVTHSKLFSFWEGAQTKKKKLDGKVFLVL